MSDPDSEPLAVPLPVPVDDVAAAHPRPSTPDSSSTVAAHPSISHPTVPSTTMPSPASLISIPKELAEVVVGYQARRILELERMVEIKRAKAERLSAEATPFFPMPALPMLTTLPSSSASMRPPPPPPTPPSSSTPAISIPPTSSPPLSTAPVPRPPVPPPARLNTPPPSTSRPTSSTPPLPAKPPARPLASAPKPVAAPRVAAASSSSPPAAPPRSASPSAASPRTPPPSKPAKSTSVVAPSSSKSASAVSTTVPLPSVTPAPTNLPVSIPVPRPVSKPSTAPMPTQTKTPTSTSIPTVLPPPLTTVPTKSVPPKRIPSPAPTPTLTSKPVPKPVPKSVPKSVTKPSAAPALAQPPVQTSTPVSVSARAPSPSPASTSASAPAPTRTPSGPTSVPMPVVISGSTPGPAAPSPTPVTMAIPGVVPVGVPLPPTHPHAHPMAHIPHHMAPHAFPHPHLPHGIAHHNPAIAAAMAAAAAAATTSGHPPGAPLQVPYPIMFAPPDHPLNIMTMPPQPGPPPPGTTPGLGQPPLPPGATPGAPGARPETSSLSKGSADPNNQASASKQSRYWTPEEHKRFLHAIMACGPKNYSQISAIVGTRNAKQVRTHAQKFQKRLEREEAKRRGGSLNPSGSSVGAAAAAAVAVAAAAALNGSVPGTLPSTAPQAISPTPQQLVQPTPLSQTPQANVVRVLQPTPPIVDAAAAVALGIQATEAAQNGKDGATATITPSDKTPVSNGSASAAVGGVTKSQDGSSSTNSNDGSGPDVKPETKASMEISAEAAAAAAVAAEAATLGRGILAPGDWQGLPSSVPKTAVKQDTSVVKGIVNKTAATTLAPGTKVATSAAAAAGSNLPKPVTAVVTPVAAPVKAVVPSLGPRGSVALSASTRASAPSNTSAPKRRTVPTRSPVAGSPSSVPDPVQKPGAAPVEKRSLQKGARGSPRANASSPRATVICNGVSSKSVTSPRITQSQPSKTVVTRSPQGASAGTGNTSSSLTKAHGTGSKSGVAAKSASPAVVKSPPSSSRIGTDVRRSARTPVPSMKMSNGGHGRTQPSASGSSGKNLTSVGGASSTARTGSHNKTQKSDFRQIPGVAVTKASASSVRDSGSTAPVQVEFGGDNKTGVGTTGGLVNGGSGRSDGGSNVGKAGTGNNGVETRLKKSHDVKVGSGQNGGIGTKTGSSAAKHNGKQGDTDGTRMDSGTEGLNKVGSTEMVEKSETITVKIEKAIAVAANDANVSRGIGQEQMVKKGANIASGTARRRSSVDSVRSGHAIEDDKDGDGDCVMSEEGEDGQKDQAIGTGSSGAMKVGDKRSLDEQAETAERDSKRLKQNGASG